MTTEDVLKRIREAIAAHQGDEAELYDALTDEAEAWYDRHNELQVAAYAAACVDDEGDEDPGVASSTNQ